MPITSWTIDPDFDKHEVDMKNKFHGYQNEKLHFDKADKKAIRNNQTIEKIKTVFSTVPYNFNIYFWQSTNPNYDLTLNKGQVDLNWIKEYMSDNVIRYIEETKSNNAITIIMTNNLSDEGKITLKSPWMIAHRIAHTVTRFSGFKQRFEVFVFDFVKLYGRRISDIEINCGDLHYYSKEIGEFLGTMQSARNKKLVNGYEFYYETFTQYIINGRIQFDISNIPLCFPEYELEIKEEDKPKVIDFVKKFENIINKRCKSILKQAIGKTYVM